MKTLQMLFIILILGIVQITWSHAVEVKITASDGEANDKFGSSVAISGDYAIVGVPLDDDAGDDSGSAYIFTRNGSNWIEQQKITSSDGAANDKFGSSVAISGDYAIVGAPEVDAAYIFVRNGGSWTEQQKITASDAAVGDLFGHSVSISGDTAIVGATETDYSRGSVYIFVRSGTNWTEQQKITASDRGVFDKFGHSVSISGDTVIVGALNHGDWAGSAYIFVRSGASWSEQQKIMASDGESWDQFGSSVSISGGIAVVGTPNDDDRTGSAYIFVRNGANWAEEQKLIASDSASYDYFGHSVSISGNTAIVGAYKNDDTGRDSGSAYIFARSGASWTEQEKITASDATGSDYFGHSVSINGNTAIVGTPGDDDLGSESGSVYIYDFAPSSTSNITVSPDPIDFVDVIVGREITVTVSIGNTGAAEFNVTDIGSDLGDILKISETAFTVAPAATHDITLTLTAASAGEISGTLTITSNDPDSPTTKIAIIGNAKLGTFQFGDVSGDGSISAFDASLILRFVVGIIDSFPVDEMIGSSPESAMPRDYEVSIPQMSLKAGQRVSVPVYVNDAASLTAGGIKIKYDTTVFKAIEVMSPVSKSYYWKANTGLNGEVRFAFVNASASSKSDGLSKLDELLLIEFETLPNTEGKTSPLILEHVQLAESLSIKKINGFVTVLPGEFRLHQNYPNPFNPETWLPYQLAKDAVVTINIYNIKGQLIRTLTLGNQKAGTYMTRNKAAHWDGKDAVGEAVSSGVYFYHLKAGDFFATRKMVILK